MHRTTLLVFLTGLAGFRLACAADVFQMPLADNMGATPKFYNQPDGTTIEWTEFFKSDASHVAVGRSNIEGSLPTEKLEYTDCFLVADGSSQLVIDGKTFRVAKGDLVLLPRGTTVQGHDFHHYVHFAASFESGPGIDSNGPKVLRRLHPEQLKDRDFTVDGDNMRHTYYRGAAGVVVRAWQSTKQDMSTNYFTSPWSELSFVVSGETTIAKEDGTLLSLKAGDSFFIARGAKVKVSAHNLRKLAVVFDQDANSSL
jgi:ethanolamine utilization protein EutQ (cupin superfamily)